MVNIYGYLCVSNMKKINDAIVEIEKQGVPQSNIYVDIFTKELRNRSKYNILVSRVKKGDLLYIATLYHLGDDYEIILKRWEYLTREKEVQLIVLDFPLLNSWCQIQGMMDNSVSDIILDSFQYFINIEKMNNRRKQIEGIKRAKEQGIRFGRPKTIKPKNFKEVYKKWEKQELSARKAAQLLGISHVTFLTWTKEEKNDQNIENFIQLE